MPEVNLRHAIDTDEDTFWSKVVFDESFNKQLYEGSLKFPGWRLLESKEDESTITRRVQVDPPVADLPGPMRKVMGDRFAYTEEGTFDKKTKRYAFTIKPTSLADKTKVSGELWAEKIDDKKVYRMCRISVEVKVFMVGGMIEERIISDLRASYDNGATFTNQYIKEQGL